MPPSAPHYRSRVLRPSRDIDAGLQAAQALRYAVFNQEMHEGLASSEATGLDSDPFDEHCDHLLVERVGEGGAVAMVGTYRMQTGVRAREGLGYYCEREFDFAPFESQRTHILELGRACIRQDHRNFTVLNLLWKGIAQYAHQQGARYLVGCSSLTSQDPAEGSAAYSHLRQHHDAPPAWQTSVKAGFACPAPHAAATEEKATAHIPRLLRAYLALGACICAPPALDAEFGTIDFLTWLDLESPTMRNLRQRGHFVS